MKSLTSSGVADLSSCILMASLRQLSISGSPRYPSLFWSYLSKTTFTVFRISSSLLIITQLTNNQSIYFKRPMEEIFTVMIGEEKLEVSKRVADVSEYISNIMFIGQGEEEIEIDENIISKDIFQEFIRFCEINDYKEPIIARPIRTSNLMDVVDRKNYEFIKEYTLPNEKTYKLLNAAEFLVCKGLKTLLAALFACKLYFQDDKPSYEKKKSELGVTQQISFQDEQRYKQTFVFQSELN